MEYMQQRPARKSKQQINLNANIGGYGSKQIRKMQKVMYEYMDSLNYLEHHPMFNGNFHQCVRVTSRVKQTTGETVFRVECGAYTPLGFIPNNLLSCEEKSYEEAIINLAGIVKLTHPNYTRYTC